MQRSRRAFPTQLPAREMKINVHSTVSALRVFSSLVFVHLSCRERSAWRSTSRATSRRGKKKSKGRKEFNIKKLSFCVDMKIPRISAFPFFSPDVCFLLSPPSSVRRFLISRAYHPSPSPRAYIYIFSPSGVPIV